MSLTSRFIGTLLLIVILEGDNIFMKIIKKTYSRILAVFIRKTFNFWQMLGIHVTRNHFYEPVPDTRTIKNSLWDAPSELAGIDIKEDKQVELLNNFSSTYSNEYENIPRNKTDIPYEYFVANKTFVAVDGEVLYCMVRSFKPSKIYEIGSGFSTYLSAKALLKNEQENGIHSELVAIEPYPNDILQKGFPGLKKLEIKNVQDVKVNYFKELKENDILFIDSSHVLKMGSDVKYEFFEILPRLNKGVIIHFHDIFLPYDYPKEWVMKDHIFWNEQYLLQAFLAFNDTFEILWAGSYMHVRHSDMLKEAFSSYNDKGWPGSFWIRKIK